MQTSDQFQYFTNIKYIEMQVISYVYKYPLVNEVDRSRGQMWKYEFASANTDLIILSPYKIHWSIVIYFGLYF